MTACRNAGYNFLVVAYDRVDNRNKWMFSNLEELSRDNERVL